jgi:hypothetical protein
MFENRIRDFLTAPVSVATATLPSPVGFVPCPLAMTVPPAYQAFVAEVYRLARELTEAQLRRSERVFPPAFSRN